MYDSLLRLTLPKDVKLVAYADDVAVVIVAKHLEEIELAFDVSFERISQWMNTVNLELAKHKTEVVLITSRKQAETITLRVGEHEITSQPFLRYLGVMIDARLNFKQQVEHVSTKASAVTLVLSRLMPNIGDPKQCRRRLLASVATSVLTYGISIWADALGIQESHRRVASVSSECLESCWCLPHGVRGCSMRYCRNAAHQCVGRRTTSIGGRDWLN